MCQSLSALAQPREYFWGTSLFFPMEDRGGWMDSTHILFFFPPPLHATSQENTGRDLSWDFCGERHIKKLLSGVIAAIKITALIEWL